MNPSRVRSLLSATVACAAVASATPTGASAAKLPNFVVSSAKIKVSQVPTSRDFVVTSVVRNTGEGKAPKSVTEFSLGFEPEDGGVPIEETQRVKALKSSKRFVVKSKVPAPDEPTSQPTVILVCADSRERVAESDEDDNCTATKTELGIVPDGFFADAEGQVQNGNVTERWNATIPLVPSFEGDHSTVFGVTGGTVNWQLEGTVPCPTGNQVRTIEGSETWPYYVPFEEGDIGPGLLSLNGPNVSEPNANSYEFQAVPGPHPGVSVDLGPCPGAPAETRSHTALNCTIWESELQSWDGETLLIGQRSNYETRLCADEGETGLNQSFSWSIARN